MRLVRWIWLGPVAFLLHDAEEIVTVEPWLAAHRAALPSLVGRFADVTTAQFSAAVGALAIGFTLASAHGARRAARGKSSIPFLAVAGAFAANGMTHLGQAAWFGGYTPGLMTAVAIVIPYSVALGRALVAERVVSRRGAAIAVLAGLVLQVPLALAALAVLRR